LELVRRLGASPQRAVVVEDAITGVQAGRAGGFRLVIGVNRSGDPGVLLEHGADLEVRDLMQVGLTINRGQGV
jgi:beta-phosphoglucomutase-like phosphatase (HAD superfamily)